jgi:hypothetical protein
VVVVAGVGYSGINGIVLVVVLKTFFFLIKI